MRAKYNLFGRKEIPTTAAAAKFHELFYLKTTTTNLFSAYKSRHIYHHRMLRTSCQSAAHFSTESKPFGHHDVVVLHYFSINSYSTEGKETNVVGKNMQLLLLFVLFDYT